MIARTTLLQHDLVGCHRRFPCPQADGVRRRRLPGTRGLHSRRLDGFKTVRYADSVPRIASLSLVFLLLLAVPWAGCAGEETSPDGSQTGAATTTSGSSSTTSSSSTTNGPPSPCDGEPNQLCDLDTESCDCADCEQTAYCIEDLCTDDGSCDPYDSCVCADCDGDYFCADPADGNCAQDGECDSFYEGCNCQDCYGHDECSDNGAACAGGAADELCDAPAEDCSCNDCLGTLLCVPCEVDGDCAVAEPCFCEDCEDKSYCVGTSDCVDDEVCGPLYEGCECEDCAIYVECGGPGVGGGNP